MASPSNRAGRSPARSALQRWKPTTAEAALRQSITENIEREAVIDRRMLEAKALQHGMGTLELSQIRSHRARLEQEGQLLQVRPSISSPHGAFTTPEMVELERANLAMMRAGQSQVRAIGSAVEVRQWAEQRRLSREQAIAAEVTLTARNWLTSIEGRAGATKTTTVGAMREFAERQGYAVYGFAPTTRAVKSLQEAGVAAQTVASLLESRSVSRPQKHIWVVDESSLLPTRQANRLLHRARDEGVARVVFVGDQRQHHAIEAGRPIFQMQEAGMTVARLDTIQRQQDADLRAAVTHAAQGEIVDALAILERRNDIREVIDPGSAAEP
jgi:hypothetical protein